MSNPYRVILITTPDKGSAEKIARGLLEQKLAACVNIIPGLESHYWWKEKIEKTAELLLIVKTRAQLLSEINAFLREHHPAEVPEAIALDVNGGHRDYLDWIGANTQFVKGEEED